MEKLNSALLAGEIPFLFTNDEMEGLLQSLQVCTIRRIAIGLNDPRDRLENCAVTER